ncbi:MAG TPA: hypothetical protein VMB77_09610 [Syntrophales bacterium]|nr:hypothetical protein [Syntrophales bacterium]
MNVLTASELLSVWEMGRSQPSHRRALLLLGAAYPETTPEELAGLSIGRRDSRLLTLREQLFGPRLVSMTGCPACGEKLELSFDVSDIRVDAGEEQNARMSLEMEGYEVLFRLPDSNDLAALAMTDSNREGRRSLVLKRCLTDVRLYGKGKQAEELPAEIVGAVTNRMSQADPQADVKLSLECPSCGNSWLAAFDILSFLWIEIESWAKRLLREIHVLARSYGWREADILAMSALRRQSYLEMLGA